ncbi:uncharacterized protein [Phyllobates terribilis]|uniref:uncharacterized protein n=1 Tax=Phyllobates terribilis TaxID=111132 RepID=UPI003CCA94F9
MRGMETAAVLLLLLSVCARCRGEEQITGVTGSNVTFRASVIVRPSEINWLKNEIKIVDLEEGKEPDFYRFYNIKERVIVNLAEKTFTLLDVIPGDSGRYKAMLLVDGIFTNIFFSLRVLDPVCNVSVLNTTVGNNVTLRCSCSSDGAEPAQYEWRNVSHRLSVQQNLTVSMGEKPQTLWCIASNEVSSSNATIIVPPRTPDYHWRLRIFIAVLVTLILIIIVLFVLYKKKLLQGLCGQDGQRVPTTDPEDPENDGQDRKVEKGAGAQDSAKTEEEPKIQNNKNSEGAQDSAQKEEEPKIQKNGNVEEPQDSAEKEDETNTSKM